MVEKQTPFCPLETNVSKTDSFLSITPRIAIFVIKSNHPAHTSMVLKEMPIEVQKIKLSGRPGPIGLLTTLSVASELQEIHTSFDTQEQPEYFNQKVVPRSVQIGHFIEKVFCNTFMAGFLSEHHVLGCCEEQLRY